MKKIEVWREYTRLEAKGEKYVVKRLAEKLGVSRQRVYQILAEVWTEDEKKKEMIAISHDEYWENKYKDRWSKIRSRRKDDVVEIKSLVCDMLWDGFTVTEIARRTGKHHTTIMHHAKDCDLSV